MQLRRLSRSSLWIFVTAFVVPLLGSNSAQPVVADGGCPSPGLQNPGFEDPTAFNCWTPVLPIPDAVQVVGAEGPTQFSVYGTAPGGP